MADATYTATRLKAELLGVLDDVERTGETVTVTKHGKAIAKLVPVEPPRDLRGSVTFLVSDEELIEPLDIWDPDFPRAEPD